MLSSSVESRLASLALDTNDINNLPEVSSPTTTSTSTSTSPSMFQFDVIAGLVPLFNTLNVRRANGHCSARALARYYAALLDGGMVPPPHSYLSQPPLRSHPHLPKSTSDKPTYKKQKKKVGFPEWEFWAWIQESMLKRWNSNWIRPRGIRWICDISNRFGISVTLNKLSFGSITKDIIQFVCSELNIPIPEDYANSAVTPIN